MRTVLSITAYRRGDIEWSQKLIFCYIRRGNKGENLVCIVGGVVKVVTMTCVRVQYVKIMKISDVLVKACEHDN